MVLDFDHFKGKKTCPVSTMARNGLSIERIQIEIDKCVVRCANCHRRRTYKQFGYSVP